MAREEDQYDYTGEAIKAAKKAEEEAKARAVAKGGTPEAPKMDRVVINALQMLAGGRAGKAARGEVLGGLYRNPNLLFAQGMSKNARERFQARFDLFDLRYPSRPPPEVHADLNKIWGIAEANGVAPKDILKNFPTKSTKDLIHSSVAAELVTRETALNFYKKFGEDPRMWYQELERAYLSIDFTKIDAKQAAELQAVFTASFDKMRSLEKNVPSLEVPKKDDVLWKGLGDYYLSGVIPEDLQPPPGVDKDKWNLERENFNKTLLDLQVNLSKPHTQNQEKEILEDHLKKLNKAWPNFNERVQSLQRRLTVELEEFSRGEGEGGLGENNAEARAKLITTYEYKERDPTYAAFSLNVEDALREFSEDKFINIRRRLNEIDGLFMLKPGQQPMDWDVVEPGKLGAALSILDDIERTSRSQMSGEQMQIIERYKGQVRSRMETLRNMDQPINRIYLGEDEKIGLEYDPIGTSERMFLEAMQAFVIDPGGPRAKFLLDRLELMQYYLFSRQHTKKVEVVIVSSKANLLKAIMERTSFQGTPESPEALALSVGKVIGKVIGKEKVSFERSFNNRLHEVLYIQQWQHIAEVNDEHFGQFLNTRMLEDDFWGMDGQFGGLLKRFRMTIANKYAQKIVTAEGNRNAHVDILWDEALRETKAELSQGHEDLEEIWDRYLAGDYFTEVPGSGVESTLARSPDAKANGVEDQMTYNDACEILTQFAAIRMIMSQEKHLIDARFMPVRWGELRGELQIDTQFLEKQKVVKLFRPFEEWQITWNGITLGYSAEERYMMRRNSETLRRTFPEADKWAQEWSDDWWTNRIEKMRDLNVSEAQKKLWWGDLRGLFIFSVEELDQVPSLDTIKKMPRYKNLAEKDRVPAWIHDNLSKKKLLEETKFYAGMKISDMINGEFPYFAVFESGARRNAAYGALKNMLGGNEEIAKQNFLAYTELKSGQEYFGKKQTEDTKIARDNFLDSQAFLSRFAPQNRLMVLREGESRTLHGWLAAGEFGGEGGFSAYYGKLNGYFEDVFAEFAMEKQVDYYEGLSALRADSDRFARIHKIFMSRNGNKVQEADAQIQWYFDEMKKISQRLIEKQMKDGKTVYVPKTIKELIDIRYGPLLWRLRRDDYPYEYMQYPERALPKLLKLEGHPLYEALHKDGIYYEGLEGANLRAKQSLTEAKHNLKQAQGKDEVDKWNGEVISRQRQYGQTQGEVNKVIKKSLDWIHAESRRESLYWTRASDRFEPPTAFDEQSGLWRRDVRDIAGRAGAWQLTGDAWSLDDRVSTDARKKRYKACVGISGNTTARLIDLMDEGQRLAIQKVYARYAPFFDNMLDSSDVKKFNPNKKSKLPDELQKELWVAQEAVGGSTRLNAPDALGLDYAVKAELGITNYNKILGGTSGRYEWLENLYDNKFIGSWAKKHLKKKHLDIAVEWLDRRIPLGVIKNNIIVGAGLTLLFLLIYTLQSAGGEEKKHK